MMRDVEYQDADVKSKPIMYPNHQPGGAQRKDSRRLFFAPAHAAPTFHAMKLKKPLFVPVHNFTNAHHH
jgi:hypothetical protein